MNDVLKGIQSWFEKNCDGDWEHAQNITITTIDNPGWGVTINLEGIYLEKKYFSNVKIDKSEADWYYCTIKNNQFQGDGGVNNLIDILKIFLLWAEKKS